MAQIILALDFTGLKEAEGMVRTLKKHITFYKVGLELFTRCGPDAVKMVKDHGCDVFLDLKLHDIPNTMAGGVAAASALGARSITLHTAAGSEALRQAKSAQSGGLPRLWGVTILSSLGGGTGIPEAERASGAGLEGVVASGEGVGAIRARFPGLEIVVPGIRPSWSLTDDQKRVLTPAEAVDGGADYLVIGRPISRSDDPLGSAIRILKEIN